MGNDTRSILPMAADADADTDALIRVLENSGIIVGDPARLHLLDPMFYYDHIGVETKQDLIRLKASGIPQRLLRDLHQTYPECDFFLLSYAVNNALGPGTGILYYLVRNNKPVAVDDGTFTRDNLPLVQGVPKAAYPLTGHTLLLRLPPHSPWMKHNFLVRAAAHLNLTLAARIMEDQVLTYQYPSRVPTSATLREAVLPAGRDADRVALLNLWRHFAYVYASCHLEKDDKGPSGLIDPMALFRKYFPADLLKEVQRGMTALRRHAPWVCVTALTVYIGRAYAHTLHFVLDDGMVVRTVLRPSDAFGPDSHLPDHDVILLNHRSNDKVMWDTPRGVHVAFLEPYQRRLYKPAGERLTPIDTVMADILESEVVVAMLHSVLG